MGMKQNAQLMPMISVDSVDEARAFYVEKLGFGTSWACWERTASLIFVQ
jgi:hypothetical protein